MVSMSLGDECRMTTTEQAMISDPLKRIMERADKETNEIISQWSDPIMLVLGLTAWGVRVWKIVEARNPKGDDDGPSNWRDEEEPEPPAPSPIRVPVGRNGNHPNDEPVSLTAPTPDQVREALTGGISSV